MKFGDDGQCVQQEQVDDAECTPELSEALKDQARVPHAGHRAEPQHHLLVDVEHRHQQQQRPQQCRAVVLPGLRVGGESAGIVVAGHYDQTRAENREQRREATAPGQPGLGVVLVDRAESTFDITEMCCVEHSGLRLRPDINHLSHPCSPRGALRRRLRLKTNTPDGTDLRAVPRFNREEWGRPGLLSPNGRTGAHRRPAASGRRALGARLLARPGWPERRGADARWHRRRSPERQPLAPPVAQAVARAREAWPPWLSASAREPQRAHAQPERRSNPTTRRQATSAYCRSPWAGC